MNENGVVEVCLDTKHSVTLPPESGNDPRLCQHCQAQPARRLYCSPACRQAAYRTSPSHRANLDAQIAFRTWRRNQWNKAKLRDKAITFDGTLTGPERKGIPEIGQFGRWGEYQPDVAIVATEIVDAERSQEQMDRIFSDTEKKLRYAAADARIMAAHLNRKKLEQSCQT